MNTNTFHSNNESKEVQPMSTNEWVYNCMQINNIPNNGDQSFHKKLIQKCPVLHSTKLFAFDKKEHQFSFVKLVMLKALLVFKSQVSLLISKNKILPFSF